MFDGQFYDQVDGVAMGSPLGPVLANILTCDFEEKWVLYRCSRYCASKTKNYNKNQSQREIWCMKSSHHQAW